MESASAPEVVDYGITVEGASEEIDWGISLEAETQVGVFHILLPLRSPFTCLLTVQVTRESFMQGRVLCKLCLRPWLMLGRSIIIL